MQPRPRTRLGAWLPAIVAAGAFFGAACSTDQGVAVPSAPTLQAVATGAAGAVSTVGSVATSAAQAGGTAVTAAAPVATGAAKAGATAVAAAEPVVTRAATAYAEAAATADARTPLNGATASPSPSPRAGGSATGRAGGGPITAADRASGGLTSIQLSATGAAVGAPRPPATLVPNTGPVRFGGVGLVAGHPAVTIENGTDAPVDLAGWRLLVDGEAVVLPPGARLAPRGSLMLHLADGRTRGTDVYLGRDSADLLRGLQPGQRAALIDAEGRTVAEVILPAL